MWSEEQVKGVASHGLVVAGIPCLEAMGLLTGRESSRHQATCEGNMVQKCWCILAIVALLVTGKATSKLHKSL